MLSGLQRKFFIFFGLISVSGVAQRDPVLDMIELNVSLNPVAIPTKAKTPFCCSQMAFISSSFDVIFNEY